VLRADDERVRSLAGETRAASVLFGYADDADVRADEVRVDWPRGTAFRVHAGGQAHAAHVGVIGRDMVPAALAALAVARRAGVPVRDALARLAALRPTVGRLEPVALPSGAYVLRDDWKGSWETAHVALAALADVPARRKIVVMGDLSEVPAPFGESMRSVGEHVARVAGRAVLVAHGKAVQAYASGAVRAGLDRERLARPGFAAAGVPGALPDDLGPGDVVLLKGSRRQRMGRVALALAGTPVTCWIETCDVKLDCEQCPLLCATPVPGSRRG
jgi:UDP-N-acetylmuramyl pentapeptide synthase